MRKNHFIISISFLTVVLVCSCIGERKIDCKKYEEGEFYQVYQGDTSFIKRANNLQEDMRNGYVTKSKLKWIKPCFCEYTVYSTTDPRVNHVIDKPMMVRIIDEGVNYYTYDVKVKSSGQKYSDTIYFIKDSKD